MIEMSVEAKELLGTARGSVRHCRVESWLGDELLSDNVPITSGREEADRTARIPERVSLRVPRYYRGESWVPADAIDHPLSANGQRLRVMLGVGLEGQEVEWIQRGEFVISESEPQGDTVNVEATGLLALIDEAKFVAPFQPNGTMKRSLLALLEPAITVLFDPTLVDRNVPGGINYDSDRLGAALELLDAWPATGLMTNEGYMYVQPADALQGISLALAANNLKELTTSSSRADGYNCVVASGTAPDGAQLQGVSYVGTGPMAYGGNFNPLPVPLQFNSPLLISVAACRAAANAIRDRLVRTTSRPYTAKTLPMFWVQLGDRVLFIDDKGEDDGTATVEALSLPYTPGDGEMSLTLVREQ